MGCVMEQTPEYYNFFYPLPNLSFMLSLYASCVNILKNADIEPLKGSEFFKRLLINYWKYGPNEWSGNYMINREDEKWPLLFIYFKNSEVIDYKFVDKLIEAKRKQNSIRHVEGKILLFVT